MPLKICWRNGTGSRWVGEQSHEAEVGVRVDPGLLARRGNGARLSIAWLSGYAPAMVDRKRQLLDRWRTRQDAIRRREQSSDAIRWRRTGWNLANHAGTDRRRRSATQPAHVTQI